MVSSLYNGPIYPIVEKIKSEPYFQWLNKMSSDVLQRNQNLFYSYHRDKGHTTKDCQTLKDHLGQLKKLGYLKEFIAQDNPWPK